MEALDNIVMNEITALCESNGWTVVADWDTMIMRVTTQYTTYDMTIPQPMSREDLAALDLEWFDA